MAQPASRALPDWVAAGVTFLASGSVLVLEVVGLRLIAPYVGITLQTSTAVIGFALAAIAIGAWTGGAAADRTDPRRLLAPLLVAGGALVVAVLPLVRFAGAVLTGAAAGTCSAGRGRRDRPRRPAVRGRRRWWSTLQLRALAETGRSSAGSPGIGTLGGIVATFATGFVLVARPPGSVILVGTGVRVGPRPGSRSAVLLRRRARGSPVGCRSACWRSPSAAPVLAAVAPTPVRAGDRLPLRAGGGRSRRHRPGAGAGHAPALLRRPRRPHPPGVRVRPGDRLGRRRPRVRPAPRCPRCTSAAEGSRCRATWPTPGPAR